MARGWVVGKISSTADGTDGTDGSEKRKPEQFKYLCDPRNPRNPWSKKADDRRGDRPAKVKELKVKEFSDVQSNGGRLNNSSTPNSSA